MKSYCIISLVFLFSRSYILMITVQKFRGIEIMTNTPLCHCYRNFCIKVGKNINLNDLKFMF